LANFLKKIAQQGAGFGKHVKHPLSFEPVEFSKGIKKHDHRFNLLNKNRFIDSNTDPFLLNQSIDSVKTNHETISKDKSIIINKSTDIKKGESSNSIINKTSQTDMTKQADKINIEENIRINPQTFKESLKSIPIKKTGNKGQLEQKNIKLKTVDHEKKDISEKEEIKTVYKQTIKKKQSPITPINKEKIIESKHIILKDTNDSSNDNNISNSLNKNEKISFIKPFESESSIKKVGITSKNLQKIQISKEEKKILNQKNTMKPESSINKKVLTSKNLQKNQISKEENKVLTQKNIMKPESTIKPYPSIKKIIGNIDSDTAQQLISEKQFEYDSNDTQEKQQIKIIKSKEEESIGSPVETKIEKNIIETSFQKEITPIKSTKIIPAKNTQDIMNTPLEKMIFNDESIRSQKIKKTEVKISVGRVDVKVEGGPTIINSPQKKQAGFESYYLQRNYIRNL
jgi:hypothetical protein